MRIQNITICWTIAKALLINALACSVAMGVTAGQVDDFEDMTLQGWNDGASLVMPVNVAGGPPGSTRYIQRTNSGLGTPGGRAVILNRTQWTGDYIAAGITEIRADVLVETSSSGPLSLRVGFSSAIGNLSQNSGYVSFDPIVVANDGLWHEVVFPVTSADLVDNGSFMTYEAVLSSVTQLRIYHATTATWRGTIGVAATMGIDNIEALAPAFMQPLLLRRASNQKWFTYVLSGSDIADSSTLAMTRGADYSVVSRADFDGDGNNDVLLRDLIGGENGRWVLNTLDGTSILSEGFADLTRNSDWVIVAIKDFDADDRADVLLRNSVDGRWLLYSMNGQAVLGSAVLTMSEDLTDVVVGSGDFNNDGRCDLLLRRADGSWLMYLLDGLNTPVEGMPAMTTNLAFTVQAIAGFDIVGGDDVLLRRDDGVWFMYTLNGSAILTSGSPNMTQNTDFSHQASVDFDGDGRADILIRRADGRWFMYTMDGTAILDSGNVAMTKNLLFTIVSTQDFDGDGHADLLLRRTDGRWVLYTMDGPTIIETAVPAMTRNEDWVPYAP